MVTAGILSGIYLYARLQPDGGYLRTGPQKRSAGRIRRSVRSMLTSTPLAEHVMQFRMRDKSSIHARIVDAGALLSVFVDRDYDAPGVDWAKARNIVDIGAHVGSFTIWAGRRAPAAQILAVEPNPSSFQLLRRNIEESALGERTTALNWAVGASPGVGSLTLVEHPLGTRLSADSTGGVTVSVGTLAGLVQKAGMTRVDVLKLDCEGMEYAIFASIDRSWLETVDVLMCEYHPEPGHDVAELDSVLRSAGFMVQHPRAPLGMLWATRR